MRTRRDSKGGFSFIEINDGSCFGNLQIIADATLDNYEAEISSLSVGSSIVAVGTLKASQGQGQATELAASSMHLIGDAPSDYPLQKKRHSFEKLREWAHLRPRTNSFGALTHIANRLSFSVHQFFQEEGFYYVNTPIITASDCEGAGQMFRVTTLPLDNLPLKDGEGRSLARFFWQANLPDRLGAIGSGGLRYRTENMYAFGPTFRGE